MAAVAAHGPYETRHVRFSEQVAEARLSSLRATLHFLRRAARRSKREFVKILFVCGAGYVYGKEIITLSLMQGLRERGHDVRCLISTWSDGEYAKRLRASSIPYYKLPLGFISKTLTRSAMRMTVDTLDKTPGLWLGYRRM